MQEILIENQAHIRTIVLNRPEASNAFTETMIQTLVSELYKADADTQVRCIILTGSGRNFCAGGDVKKMLKKEGMFSGAPNELRERYKRGIQQIPLCFRALQTPVIAAVNGAAIGAGLDLACMCDIRIAADNSRFGETFARIGLIPGVGGSFFLQRVIGFAAAMELTLTGRVFDSKEAKGLGLITHLVDKNSLMNKAFELATLITQNAPIAISMAKRSLEHAYRADLDSSLELLAAYQGITQRTQDHVDALKAQQSKSQATYKYN